MKPLIISLAFPGREDYLTLQKGLIKSIEQHWDGEAWINPDIPYTPHSEVPYKFKYDLIEAAAENGFRKIWWMDSTMRLKKNPSPLLADSEYGVVAFDNIGHPVWRYLSDEAMYNLGMDEGYIKNIRQIWGGCTGWDFEKAQPGWIFRRLQEQIRLGSFNEGGSKRDGFVATRHDQSCLSVLLYMNRMPLLDYGVIAAPKDVTDKTYIIYGD